MNSWKLLPALSLLIGCTAAADPASAEAGAAMLPARTLHCTLGHALNLDPTREQTIADIRYEGAHPFTLYLAPAPAHIGPPPEPTADPEPVDPATRVLSDPSGIAGDMRMPFYRVVDLWPHRVEMMGLVEPPLGRIVIVSEIDIAKGTANLFTTRAGDAADLDLDKVYQGGCTIETGAVAAVAVSPPSG